MTSNQNDNLPSSTQKPLIPDSNYVKSLISKSSSTIETSNLINQTIQTLKLQVHPEGGYFIETDRDLRLVSNPFLKSNQEDNSKSKKRNASTTIYYFLDPKNPIGHFHRNKSRTIHTLHQGRGRYIIIHADDQSRESKVKVETFIVGHDINNDEKLQWIVEGGKFKSSFLLPDIDSEESDKGLLISETVIPGFDFDDHDFMKAEDLKNLVDENQGNQLVWLLKSEERSKWDNLSHEDSR